MMMVQIYGVSAYLVLLQLLISGYLQIIHENKDSTREFY